MGGGTAGSPVKGLKQQFDLLDKEFAAMSRAICSQRFALWVGSGVSSGSAPNLGNLLAIALEHLRSRADPMNAACRFSVALDDILRRSGMAHDTITALDKSIPFESWPEAKSVISGLWEKYSSVLDTRIDGEDPDYMLWSAVDVRKQYGGLTKIGVSHLCIAVLLMEGVFAEVISANWDGLIEFAVERLSGSGAMLQVVVGATDLRAAPTQARLLKFHGCAERAVRDPSLYRKYLVGAQSQITDWRHNELFAPIKTEMIATANRSHTLMTGLSLQDPNLQDLFAQARRTCPWPWPCGTDAQGHVFCQTVLGDNQIAMLRVVYGASYSGYGREIERSALFPAYAAPTLMALVAQVLFEKLATLSVMAAPGMAGGEQLRDGLQALRDIATQDVSTDDIGSVEELVRRWSATVETFRKGEISSANTGRYASLTMTPLDKMVLDPSLPSSGLMEMSACLGLLGHGVLSGQWSISIDGSGPSAAIVAKGRRVGAKATRLYLVSGAAAAVRLIRSGDIDREGATVVHADDGWFGAPGSKKSARTPTRPIGRTGRPKARHVCMSDIIAHAPSFPELSKRFSQAVVI